MEKNKKTIQSIIVVDVKNIEVENGYYGFDYEVVIDGKLKKGHYESDYDNWTEKSWLEELSKGYAVKQALEDCLD